MFLDSKCHRGRDSLRGRRSKGKGKGIRARDHAQGRREEGNRSFPFSVARLTRSRAPKFPLPYLTSTTQAQPRLQGFSLKKWVGRENALASAGHVALLNIYIYFFRPTYFLREKPWGWGCLPQYDNLLMYPSFKISFTNSWDGKPFECKIGFVFENEKKNVFFVTALTGSGKGGGGVG